MYSYATVPCKWNSRQKKKANNLIAWRCSVTMVVIYICVLSITNTLAAWLFVRSSLPVFQRRLKAAAGVMSLLGTGWFVGIFMSLPSVEIQIALQYLFIILNSTQVSLLSLFVFLNFLCADILKELSSVLTQRSNYSYWVYLKGCVWIRRLH